MPGSPSKAIIVTINRMMVLRYSNLNCNMLFMKTNLIILSVIFVQCSDTLYVRHSITGKLIEDLSIYIDRNSDTLLCATMTIFCVYCRLLKKVSKEISKYWQMRSRFDIEMSFTPLSIRPILIPVSSYNSAWVIPRSERNSFKRIAIFFRRFLFTYLVKTTKYVSNKNKHTDEIVFLLYLTR